MPFRIPNTLQRTRVWPVQDLPANRSPIERRGHRILHNLRLLPNGIPVRPAPRFYGQVPVINVRKSNDLLAIVEVQETLFVVHGCLPDFREHVGKRRGIGPEDHYARVEPDREPSEVSVRIQGGTKDEREVK